MSPTEVIEIYIHDTVRLLPRRLRDDVATELRSLLNEELHARAKQAGRAPDEAMALALVRGYGAPNEAAARYHAPWTIIDPADSTSYLRAAIIGSCSLIIIGGLSRGEPESGIKDEDLVKLGIFAWLGLLVVFFGIKNWLHRRRPNSAGWKPRDRDRVNRVGTAFMVPIAACCVVLYAVPTWVLNLISRGRFDTSWSVYTEEFQRSGVPTMIFLLGGTLVLLSYAAVQGRWRRVTRRIDLALNMALAAFVMSLAIDGNIFESAAADLIAQDVLSLVAAIYIPFVGIMLYAEIGRVEITREA